MSKPQKGKQTSRVPMPTFFRFVDSVSRLQETCSACRTKVGSVREHFRVSIRSFLFAVNALTNSEERNLRRALRQEKRKEELKAIGRRLLRS